MAFEKYHHQVAVDTDQVREERHTAEDGTITITEVPVTETVEIVLPKVGAVAGRYLPQTPARRRGRAVLRVDRALPRAGSSTTTPWRRSMI